MPKTFAFNRNLLFLSVPILLFGSAILLIKNVTLTNNPTFSLAITADLVLTIPLIYFLVIRKTNIPKITVVSMMVVGLIIGTYVLPKNSQTYLELFKAWALPVIELGVLSIVVFKVYQAIRKFKSLKGVNPDFFTTLKNTCAEILPQKLVMPLASEIAMVYYGFLHWKKRPITANEFTHHRKSGTAMLLGVFVFLILIETIAFHLVLIRWNPTVAWVIFIISAYTAIQFFAFARSLSKRPIEVSNQQLTLRYGILSEAQIPMHEIASLEISKEKLEFKGLTRKLSPLGELENHNMILKLKTPQTLIGIYGIKREFDTLAFFVDEPENFETQVLDRLRALQV